MSRTKKVIRELIENKPEPIWNGENGAANTEDSSEQDMNGSEDPLAPEDMLIEELVYPYEITEELCRSYEREVFNSAIPLKPLLIKLYRSVKYWRLKMPPWLVRRLEL